jgi:hypothetical protein
MEPTIKPTRIAIVTLILAALCAVGTGAQSGRSNGPGRRVSPARDASLATLRLRIPNSVQPALRDLLANRDLHEGTNVLRESRDGSVVVNVVRVADHFEMQLVTIAGGRTKRHGTIAVSVGGDVIRRALEEQTTRECVADYDRCLDVCRATGNWEEYVCNLACAWDFYRCMGLPR